MDVGVCDDDAQIRAQLITLLQNKNWPVPVQIQQFSTLTQVTAWPQPLDVLFLDIEVGQENSLLWLAQHQPLANDPLVVLISSHSCYVTGSYQVSVFQFLLKPLLPDLLYNVFGHCCQQYQRRKQYLRSKNRKRPGTVFTIAASGVCKKPAPQSNLLRTQNCNPTMVWNALCWWLYSGCNLTAFVRYTKVIW